MSPNGRVAALTGLRGIAVALVVLAHLHLPRTSAFAEAGVFGVDVFFVLSGFLITHVLRGLAADVRTRRWLQARSFLARRAVRLMPALAVTLVALAAWALAAGAPLGCLGFAASHTMDLPVGGALSCPGPLHITWSLAAEEQFYLVWPLAVLGLARLRPVRAAALCFGLYAGLWGLSLGVALASSDTAGWWNYAPLGRPSALLLGAGLGFLISLHPRSRGAAFTPFALPVLVLGFAAATVLLPTVNQVVLGPLVGVPAVLVTAVAVRSPWSLVARLCRYRVLVRLGEISYALYLVHVLVLRVVPGPIGLALSLLSAWCLHRWVEEPCRRRGYAWLSARELSSPQPVASEARRRPFRVA